MVDTNDRPVTVCVTGYSEADMHTISTALRNNETICISVGNGMYVETILEYSNIHNSLVYLDSFDEIDYRHRLFCFLKTICNEAKIPKKEKKNILPFVRKRFNRKMLFCKSGHLPERIRSKKKAA